MFLKFLAQALNGNNERVRVCEMSTVAGSDSEVCSKINLTTKYLGIRKYILDDRWPGELSHYKSHRDGQDILTTCDISDLFNHIWECVSSMSKHSTVAGHYYIITVLYLYLFIQDTGPTE